MDEKSKETALTIVKLETQLQELPEQVKAQIEYYNHIKENIAQLKQRLKEETKGKIFEEISVGNNKLTISIYDKNTVVIDDPEQVPIDNNYTDEVMLTGVYVKDDGNYYHKVPNRTKIANLYNAGADLPEGCSVKTVRSISMKFNKETL